MRKIIHVNQQIIARNRKTGSNDPPLIVRTYKGSRNASELVIRHPDGTEVARFIYRPHDPLRCGARLWVETELEVELS